MATSEGCKEIIIENTEITVAWKFIEWVIFQIQSNPILRGTRSQKTKNSLTKKINSSQGWNSFQKINNFEPNKEKKL